MDICKDLIKELNNLPRYSFPFEKKDIYKNGVYILFEKGEYVNNLDRVVRIGTHTGTDNLYTRITEHFMIENKDRSIFRKNIGRVILTLNNDPYIDIWNKDFKLKKTRSEFGKYLDKDKQIKLEQQITKYIQDNFSFSVIEVPNLDERLLLESKLIGTISSCYKDYISDSWYGLKSPKREIRESGLWQVRGLYKNKFTEEEYIEFKKLLK